MPSFLALMRKVWLQSTSRGVLWWSRMLAFVGENAVYSEEEQTAPKPCGKRYIGISAEQALDIAEAPYGTIYYVRKGRRLGFGLTAHVELTPEGYVVKTPKSNPYDLEEQDNNLEDMRTEAEVYSRVGCSCLYIPKFIAWNPKTCCLSLEYLGNGALATYITQSHIDSTLRRRWVIQVARGLHALHAKNIIHGDLTPRNVLLGADLNARVSDFAGSCFDGMRYRASAGERYVAPNWTFEKTPEPLDDIFVLGGLIYFTMTSNVPHHDIEDDSKVSECYRAGIFPDIASLDCGSVVLGCWNGLFKSTDEVLDQLLAAWGRDDDPLFTVNERYNVTG